MKKFLLLTVTLSVLLTGCTGPFALTKKLHNWQIGSNNKWADEALFLGCAILPIYLFATLGDVIIFNSIEFWGSDNPISAVNNQNGDELCLRSVAEQM